MLTATLDGPDARPTPSSASSTRTPTSRPSYGGNFVELDRRARGQHRRRRRRGLVLLRQRLYSDVGAGEATSTPGDRIWWDYRDWSEAYRVPAVVGSLPEPFLHGYDGERARRRSSSASPAPTAVRRRRRRLARGRRRAERRGRRHARRRTPDDAARPRRPLGGAALRSGRPPARGGPGEQRRLRARSTRAATAGELDDPRLRRRARGSSVSTPASSPPSARAEDAADLARHRHRRGRRRRRRGALLDEETLRDRYAVAAEPAGGEPLPIPAPDDERREPRRAAR